jgi:hypothetical protein
MGGNADQMSESDDFTQIASVITILRHPFIVDVA